MIVYIVIALVILSFLYSFVGKKKPQGGRSSSNSTEKSSVPVSNKALSGESLILKHKLRLPDHGGVITISLQAIHLNEFSLNTMNETVKLLLDMSSVYIFIECTTDAQETEYRELFRSSLPALTKSHHILFYSMNKGKIAFIRQLKPHVHIEYDAEVYEAIVKHVPITVMQQSISFASFTRSYPYTIQSITDLPSIAL